MSWYYFNIRYGERVFDDEEGSEHASQDAAWHEATQTCGQMLRDLDGKLRDGDEWRMEVTNKQRAVIFLLRFTVEKGPGYAVAAQ
jgi:hypothetical protein